MGKLFRNNLIFLLPALAFILAGSLSALCWSKQDIHIAVNQLNSPPADVFFKWITHAGHGLFAAFVAAVLLFIRYRFSIILILGFSLSGIIVRSLKRFVFHDVARPTSLIDQSQLHLVEGVKILSRFSFPSGHSASAFALFFALAVVSKNKFFKAGMFCLALLVAFSRVYLSQHFLIDIAVGAAIGSFVSFLIASFILSSNRNWLNYSLIRKKS